MDEFARAAATYTMKANPKTSRLRHATLWLAACAIGLAGCASDPAGEDGRAFDESPSLRTPPARRATIPPGGTYRVVKGDTLYSIAFKRGLDYRDVAAWNGISAPEYKILIGQELRLSPPGAPAAAARPAAVATPSAATNPPAPSRSATKDTGLFEDVPNTPAPAPASVESTAAASSATASGTAPPATATPSAKPAAEPAPPPSTKPANDAAVANTGGIAWRWPNGGKVIGTYVAGDQTRQGIDIAGSAGDPVLAAADGEVVYSGNGLPGYGELVIVKHDASFLSAYGHNRKRLVAEGDKVRAGQPIAEMGSSAGSRDELHFEIRKNGKPVNPLDYLPRR